MGADPGADHPPPRPPATPEPPWPPRHRPIPRPGNRTGIQRPVVQAPSRHERPVVQGPNEDEGPVAGDPGGAAELGVRLRAAMSLPPPVLGGAPTQPLEVGRTTRVIQSAQRT